MNTFEMMTDFKSKVESNAQIEQTPTIVTEISGNRKHSKAVVMREVEGCLMMVEVTMTLLGAPVVLNQAV